MSNYKFSLIGTVTPVLVNVNRWLSLVVVVPEDKMTKNIKWGSVIRDVVIIWILTALGGFVVGVTGAPDDNLMTGIAFANIIFGIVGFTISGGMAKINRWRHLFIVAIGVWLVGIINVFIMPVTIISWFFGFIFIAFMMVIGGGLSYLFVRDKKPTKITDVQLDQTEDCQPISKETKKGSGF